MKTSEFLDILEHQKLVSGGVLSKLREKVKKDPERVTPKAILKYLVKKEIVPRDVAYQLLRTTITVSPNAESSILGFVPLPQTPPAAPDKPSSPPPFKSKGPAESRQNVKIEQLDQENSESSNIFDTGEPQAVPPSPGVSSLASLSGAEKAQSEHAAVYEEVIKEPKKKSKKRQKKESEWDSSLIQYGGGGLLVLILLGGVIYYLLNRENAEVVLDQARDYFNGGSYTQAINQYEHFLKVFPHDAQASYAKVQLGVARLWKATTGTKDFVGALQTAKEVLDQIDDEPGFDQAQRDLASLLPKITQGLATQAEEATDLEVAQQRVDQTRQALSLYMNTRYIPTKFRDEAMLGEVEQALLRVERSREQALDLEKTLAAIDTALANGQISQAYDLRNELLEKHPALLRDEQLGKKVQEISAAEAAVVSFSAEEKAATQGPRESPIVASLALAERSISLPAEVEDVVAFRVGGAVYGLRASDGSLLWREYLGIDPRSAPLRLDQGDILVSDRVHHELVRLDSVSGKVLWRLGFEGDILEPVVEGGTCYVAETTGRLHAVNLSEGVRTGAWQFGQGLAAPPTVDTRNGVLYIAGEHSSLYCISLQDNRCLGVFYLGHRAGEVEEPAVRILNKVVVAVNTGPATSELRVLALSDQGAAISQDVSRRLKGIVNTPLATRGRRLAVLTNHGQVKVFEVVAAEGEKSLSTIAEHEVGEKETVAHFGLLEDSNLWVAGQKLSKLGILATGSKMRIRDLESDFLGDTFDHQFVQAGDLILHARHPANRAGMIVAATQADDGKVAWQTELAVPLAGDPVIDPDQGFISAVTASGAAYQLDRQAMTRRVQDESHRITGNRRSLPVFQTSVDLGEGRIVAGEVDKDTLLHFRPGVSRNAAKKISLAGPLSSELVGWNKGFVAPLSIGQVYLFDAEGGEQLGSPFQPPLSPGDKFHWLAPAVVNQGEDSQLAITDGVEKVYLLTYQATPQPHLEVAREQVLEGNPLETRLAAVGDLLVAGTESGNLVCLQLPDLTPKETIALGGRVVWGPFAHAQGVLLATDAGELVEITPSGQIGWKTSLGDKTPVGRPLLEENSLLVAWQRAGISRIALSDGSEQATLGLEQTLAAGPLSFGSRLLAVADDGTLLVVKTP